jgi:hypothetical protein
MSKNINLKNKKGNKKRLFKIKSSLFNFLTSLSTFEFVIIGILCTVLVFATTIVLNRAFNKALINKYKANLQNSTVVCASEYKNFSSLDEAKEQGIYNRLNVASALSNSRYRVVNSNLEVLWDTYYIDDGRTLINSKLEHKSGKLWNNNCLKITLLKFFSTIEGIFLFLLILEPSSPVGVSLYPYSIIFSSLFPDK